MCKFSSLIKTLAVLFVLCPAFAATLGFDAAFVPTTIRHAAARAPTLRRRTNAISDDLDDAKSLLERPHIVDIDAEISEERNIIANLPDEDVNAPQPETTMACKDNNTVLNRVDNFNVDDYPEDRFYSVVADRTNLPVCETVAALQAAVRHGSRVWVHSDKRVDPKLGPAFMPSIFVPSECGVPEFTPSRFCTALQRYDKIVQLGDSLMRHLMTGMRIVGTGDIEHAGGKVNSMKCRCDGLFSEIIECREDDLRHSQVRATTAMCPHYGESVTDRIDWEHSDWKSLQTGCTGGRGMYIVQGGVHNDPAYAASWPERVVKQVHNELEAVRSFHAQRNTTCKVDVVVLGAGCEARRLDKVYPTQTRERTVKFNDVLRDVFVFPPELAQTVTVIDWWRLTQDAPTSDGFHFLTDVNVFKASVLLRMMELLH